MKCGFPVPPPCLHGCVIVGPVRGAHGLRTGGLYGVRRKWLDEDGGPRGCGVVVFLVIATLFYGCQPVDQSAGTNSNISTTIRTDCLDFYAALPHFKRIIVGDTVDQSCDTWSQQMMNPNGISESLHVQIFSTKAHQLPHRVNRPVSLFMTKYLLN